MVVILSAYDDEHYVRAALAAGVVGLPPQDAAQRTNWWPPCGTRAPAVRPAARGPAWQGEKDLVDTGPGRAS